MQISKNKGKKKQNVISLPKEVVVEILQRVPCLDLYENLKKVCMDWCWIIYSGSFAYSHIERRILKSSSSFLQLEAVVITTTRTDDHMCSVTVSYLDWHSIPSDPLENDWYTEHLYTFEDALGTVVLRGLEMYTMRLNSVNGLICFWSSDGRIHVCNPITADYVTTPAYKFILHALNPCRPTATGFGFCQLSFEYKVVVLEDTLDGEIKTFVLTIGTDRTWRSLKPILDRRFLMDVDTGVHVNGVLYWYVETCTCTDWRHVNFSNNIENLICIDVTKEVVDMIVLPFERLQVISGNCIAEKGGKLCLINISKGPMYSLLIQLYVAYNIDDLSCLNSWKKEFNVTVPNLAYNVGVSRLFVLVVTDDILVIRFNGSEDYGFFDVATGMLLGVYPVNYSEAIVSYVPSLVDLRHRPPLPSIC